MGSKTQLGTKQVLVGYCRLAWLQLKSVNFIFQKVGRNHIERMFHKETITEDRDMFNLI